MDGNCGCRRGLTIIGGEEVKEMGYIKGDEVRGYRFENEVVCCDCTTRQELQTLKEEQVITTSAINEEDYYSCDRCEELL